MRLKIITNRICVFRPGSINTGLSLVVLVFFLFSCGNKKKNIEPEYPTYVIDNNFGFKKGNWWVYTCTGTPPYDPPYKRDSIVVDRDTLINGRTYYKFKSYTTPNSNFSLFPLTVNWYSDSANFIISNTHKRYYTTTDYTPNLITDSMVVDNGSGPELIYKARTFRLAGSKNITVNNTEHQTWVNVYEVTPGKPNPPYNGTKRYYHYLNNVGFIKYEFGYLSDSSKLITNELVKWNIPRSR